jgi:hypothetical protein
MQPEASNITLKYMSDHILAGPCRIEIAEWLIEDLEILNIPLG